MRQLKQSTAYNLTVLMVDSSDHITGKTGLTLTITASKNGAAFASITPTVTELSYGWYKVALATAHLDTVGDLAIHITGTGADPCDVALLIREVTTDDLVRATIPANTLDVSATGEAGLDFANIKAATGATTLTNITVPVVTSVTNDVGITQTGADKVWDSTARTLTSFGTLVSDVATAVWGSTTRTLSSFGTLVSDIWANTSRTLSAFSFTVDTTSDTNISAIKVKTDNLPVNPASQTNLDVAVSTRLASSAYETPPSAADIATAVWAATTRTLSGFGTLVSDITSAVWATATRTITAFGFSVDTNSDTNISAIKAKTDNLPVNPASQTNLDVAVSTRLASSVYETPPSGSDIATAVWGATTRTLSGFGSLVSDITSGVWSYVTRTLTSSGSGGATAQEVWEYSARTLTGFSFSVDTNSDTNISAIKTKTDNLPLNPASQTNLDVAVSTRLASSVYETPPSAADIATAVWGATTRTLSGFGSLVSDIASAVWAYVTRTLTSPGSGGATAQEVWEYNARTLTGFSFAVDTNSDTNISAIKAKTDNLPANPASQTNLDVAVSTRMATSSYEPPPSATDITTAVWGATTRTLSGFGSLVSDIAEAVWSYVTRVLTSATGGAGATAQEVWEYGTRTVTDVRMENLDAPISEIGNTLTGLSISYVGPMLQGGNAEIVVGDDYLAADGRALSWTITNPPDLAGAEIYFVYGDNSALATNVDNVISVELTSLQTITMLGSQKFSLIAKLVNGHKATLLQGSIVGR